MSVIPIIGVSFQGKNIQELQLWDGCCSYLEKGQQDLYTMLLANTIFEME
jgi:hypothetical protein